MKIGDKVLVTYSNGDQFAGRIFGETAKSWKIEFDDGDQRTIRKTMDIEVLEVEGVSEPVVIDPILEKPIVKTPVEEVKPYEPSVYTPSKKIKRNNLIILGVIVVVALAIAYFVVTGIGIF